MNILIRDIPQDGQEFSWAKDKVSVKGYIYPIKGGFDLHGEILASATMDCSFCANPLEIPVKEKFHEIIMLQPKGKATESKEFHQDDIEMHYVDGNEIDLSPIIEQVVQVSLPLQPKCVEKGAPATYPKCVADWDYTKYFEEDDGKKLTISPFDVLKNLKKN